MRLVVNLLGVLLSLVVGVIALIVWTYGLVLIIGLGVGDALNWPDLSHMPGGEAKGIAFALLAYVAMTGLVTGLWPAFRVARWFWHRYWLLARRWLKELSPLRRDANAPDGIE